MGLFDFLKRNKNKPIDNNSNTMEGELPEDLLEKVDNYGSEGLEEALKDYKIVEELDESEVLYEVIDEGLVPLNGNNRDVPSNLRDKQNLELSKVKPKEWIHDAKWRENSHPQVEPGFIRYRFGDVLRGGNVTKEYVKPSDMNNGNHEGELSEKELEEVKAGVHHFDEESDEQHKSR